MGQEKEKEQKTRSSQKSRCKIRVFWGIIQHIMLMITALAILVVTIGSTVRIQGFRENQSYSLYASDQSKVYEESDLFNNVLGYAVADIIRYGVVSCQLETEGVFDGKKVIDVTAYNYRTTGIPKQYVTAKYYLEDLLKWDTFGFEYTDLDVPEDQFLSNHTKVVVVDQDSKYYNTSDANYLKSDVDSYTFINDVSSNQIMIHNDDNSEAYDGFVDGYKTSDENILQQNTESAYIPGRILVNRYKTVEGKNLEEYVSDWNLYYSLSDNVVAAAKALEYNYNEYMQYREYYDVEKSNVRYMILKTVGEDTQFYTNINDYAKRETIMDAMESGKYENSALSSGKYIYYSPSDMVYRTNTAIQEDTIRKIVSEYDYAYPESIKMWIAVDTTYPVSDCFTQGAAGFRNYLPYFWQWIAVACIAAVFYIVLLCYLTIVTGREYDENGKSYIALSRYDHICTELAFIIPIVVINVLLMMGAFALDVLGLQTTFGEIVYQDSFKIALMVVVFVMDALIMFFYYSLVRRIKAHSMWKDSLLRKIVLHGKSFAFKVYDNGNVVVRSWVPYCIFLLFNLLIALWAMIRWNRNGDLLPLFIALVVDIAVGILYYLETKERQVIVKGIEKIAAGEVNHQINAEKMHGDNLNLANSVNSIGKGIKEAVEISMKDERMKADLITNVSHDIKTPLTSIINYVDLIKREQIDNEKVRNYVKVLDEKSQRLKQLTDDLVEASKISSGNISLHFEKINITELMNQAIGEFSEKFEEKDLVPVMTVNAANVVIEADSRRIWRVMENLFNNIFKYALERTRVYILVEDSKEQKDRVVISVKNISASPLNCDANELTERFIRGDVSRTTEGSGLGLSIAKNLTEAQNGTFEILLDGDLFKVIMTFPNA